MKLRELGCAHALLFTFPIVIAAISLNSQTFLGHNRAVYQELRAALQLPLRRQLLIAVCDHSGLQDQLAQQLEADLKPWPGQEKSRLSVRADQLRADQSPLVTLRLEGNRPDLVREVLLWLKQERRLSGHAGMIPAFQIVGVDALTGQSPAVQNRFLASLIRVDALLTQLDCRLVVWVPRPWLGKIRQMVPGFWRSRNGLYEFEGEPTPAASAQSQGDSAIALAMNLRRLTGNADPRWPFEDGTASGMALGDWETDLLWGACPVVEGSPHEPSRNESPGSESSGNESSSNQELGDRTELLPKPPGSASLPPAALPLPPALTNHAPIRQLGDYIQRLHEQQAGPLTLGRAHLALGQLCREQIVPGAAGLPILAFAVEVYQRAIQGLLAGESDWCDALNDLASLYWMRAQREPQPEAVAHWLQRSVEAYHQAIEGQTSATPETLGRLYSNLGSVHELLADLADPKFHLEQAVEAHTQALHHTPAAIAPLDYANSQNSLGAIHWRLSQLDQPRHHLHRAIVAYQEALRYRVPQAEPQDYAMLQNNLGIAYWGLARHETHPIAWLEQAIDAYQTALVYRTLSTSPAGCAATQNNLGTAYWDLAQQQTHQPAERLLSLRQAVEAYEAALDAVEYPLQQSSSSPGFDVWATCHSAGIVHDQLALALPDDPPGERERHLKAALRHYVLAYQGWQDRPEKLDLLAEAVVYSVRLNFEILGFVGQQAVLSELPPELLARVLPQL